MIGGTFHGIWWNSLNLPYYIWFIYICIYVWILNTYSQISNQFTLDVLPYNWIYTKYNKWLNNTTDVLITMIIIMAFCHSIPQYVVMLILCKTDYLPNYLHVVSRILGFHWSYWFPPKMKHHRIDLIDKRIHAILLYYLYIYILVT